MSLNAFEDFWPYGVLNLDNQYQQIWRGKNWNLGGMKSRPKLVFLAMGLGLLGFCLYKNKATPKIKRRKNTTPERLKIKFDNEENFEEFREAILGSSAKIKIIYLRRLFIIATHVPKRLRKLAIKLGADITVDGKE
jgi:hypothetical protein